MITRCHIHISHTEELDSLAELVRFHQDINIIVIPIGFMDIAHSEIRIKDTAEGTNVDVNPENKRVITS